MYTIVYELDIAGNPTDANIRFDFVGSIASGLESGKPIFAAIASSTHESFKDFPRQVAIKMMRKESLLNRDYDSMDYATIVCEAQTMRRLALAGTKARFSAGALATFQDANYFYVVSVSPAR